MILPTSRLFYLLERISRALGGPPSMVPALVSVGCVSSSEKRQVYGLQQMIRDIRVLLGVPKYRTSQPKLRTRKFSYTRIITPVKDLVTCPNCGSFHQQDTICGTCYEVVRKITSDMKRKMMDYNPYIGEKQPVLQKFEFAKTDCNQEVVNGKRVVEAKKPPKSWFKRIYS